MEVCAAVAAVVDVCPDACSVPVVRPVQTNRRRKATGVKHNSKFNYNYYWDQIIELTGTAPGIAAAAVPMLTVVKSSLTSGQ